MGYLDMVDKLYYVEIDENIDENIYAYLLSLISLKKQHKISKFKFAVNKKLSLFSDILVQYIACQILNVTTNDLHFANNEYGKPYLVGYPNFHYNISHTINAIVVGVSNKPIGVDIEKIKQSDLKIAKRFFTDNEINYTLSDTKRYDKLFYEIWTRKEAYIKWDGRGLSIPLKSFDVKNDICGVTIRTFLIQDYLLSVCCEKAFTNDDIEAISEEDMIKTLVE